MISYSEKIKIERMLDTYSANYRLTRLYAEYLERYPELITEDMIRALTEDGEISAEEAIAAILAEAFALSFDDPEDRVLMRNYLPRSIRLLDAGRYTDDPYYKNIKIPDVCDGSWEFRTESYPPYRGVIAADMILDGFVEIPPLGFFTETFRFPAVLEDGNEWMTLTPVDLDTCTDAIEAAHGKVVTFGLGLGYYTYMVSQKPSVESVTVVEKSPKVIELFKKYILPQFTNAQKVRIVEADAFEYAREQMPTEEFDVAFVDTWRDASDGAPMYRRMKELEHLSKNTEFIYWIENFIISRIRAEKISELSEKMESGALSFSEIMKILNFS